MDNTLDQIKDEVAIEQGYQRFPSFYSQETISKSIIDQIAIRYANEQNRELLDMLEMVVMDLEERGRAYGDIYTMSKNLITKHKQS